MMTDQAVPLVRPVQVTVQRLGNQPRPPGPLERCVVWPDIQGGFRRNMRTGLLEPTHDRAALDVALQVTRAAKPTRVVLLGDNLDLPDWSLKFLRSPEFYFSTQPAAIEIAWWIGQIRATVGRNVPIDYIEGNHEFRMEVALQANMIAAYDLRPADDLDGYPLLTVPRLLGLDALGVEYHRPYPQGEVWLNDNLRLHHGEVAQSKSGATVRAVVNDLRHSEGQGHVHRVELATKTAWTRYGPKTYMAFSPGTLCSILPGVVPGAKYRQNWQQGLAIIDYEPGDGNFHVDLVNIFEGKTMWGGGFVARDPREIVAELPSGAMTMR